MTVLEKVRLLQRVAADRAIGVAWSTIVARERVPERTLRSWLAEFDASEAQLDDMDGVVRESLHLYDEAIQFLFQLASRADNSSAAVGAMAKALDAVKARLELVAAVTRFRSATGEGAAGADAVWLVREAVAILEQQDVGSAAIEALLEAVERRNHSSPGPARRAHTLALEST